MKSRRCRRTPVHTVSLLDSAAEVEFTRISIRALDQCQEILDAELPRLRDSIQGEHHFRDVKLAHTHEVVARTLEILADSVHPGARPDIEAMATLAAKAHDLGRFVEARKQNGELPPDYRKFGTHGEESVNLLRDFGIEKILGYEVFRILTFAVESHCNRYLKQIADTEKMMYARLLRDADKIANLGADIELYLLDEEWKRKECHTFGFKGEQGEINPGSVIQDFVAGKPLNWRECISYEAYMLYALAFVFDINFKKTLQEFGRLAIVDKLLSYLQRRTPSEQFMQIYVTIEEHMRKARRHVRSYKLRRRIRNLLKAEPAI